MSKSGRTLTASVQLGKLIEECAIEFSSTEGEKGSKFAGEKLYLA